MKKITKKNLTKLWKLENSTWNIHEPDELQTWTLPFWKRFFYIKYFLKVSKISKTIFYGHYTQKYQSNFFSTSLYLSLDIIFLLWQKIFTYCAQLCDTQIIIHSHDFNVIVSENNFQVPNIPIDGIRWLPECRCEIGLIKGSK